MRKIIVCGIGTEVGKTLVSAILVQALQAHYWKPVQAGHLHESDTQVIQHLIKDVSCYPEAYRLQHPLSPHHGAALEQLKLESCQIILPQSTSALIIELAGGVLVPLNEQELLIDCFIPWDCEWIIVSRHYLGSINHTLLTVEALQKRQVNVKGLIFNGTSQEKTEQFILSYTGLPYIGHLYPEIKWNTSLIEDYADKWKPYL